MRAALYDARGDAVRRTEVRHPYTTRAGEADADALLRLSARSLTEVLEAAGTKAAGRIAGVGVSTFWHGLLGADDAGRALTPVLLWGDTRSAEASERLRGFIYPNLTANQAWKRYWFLPSCFARYIAASAFRSSASPSAPPVG